MASAFGAVVHIPRDLYSALLQCCVGNLPLKSDKHVLAMALADLLMADLDRYPRQR